MTKLAELKPVGDDMSLPSEIFLIHKNLYTLILKWYLDIFIYIESSLK